MQMKHMMDSFEAQKKKNGKKNKCKTNVDKRNKNGTRMKMKTRSELKK